jgi:hypothetical protein
MGPPTYIQETSDHLESQGYVINRADSLEPDIKSGERPLLFNRPVGMVTEFVDSYQSHSVTTSKQSRTRSQSIAKERSESEASIRLSQTKGQITPYISDSGKSRSSEDVSKTSIVLSNDIAILQDTASTKSGGTNISVETSPEVEGDNDQMLGQLSGKEEDKISPELAHKAVQPDRSIAKDAGLGSVENITHAHPSSDDSISPEAPSLDTEGAVRQQVEECTDPVVERDVEYNATENSWLWAERSKKMFQVSNSLSPM